MRDVARLIRRVGLWPLMPGLLLAQMGGLRLDHSPVSFPWVPDTSWYVYSLSTFDLQNTLNQTVYTPDSVTITFPINSEQSAVYYLSRLYFDPDSMLGLSDTSAYSLRVLGSLDSVVLDSEAYPGAVWSLKYMDNPGDQEAGLLITFRRDTTIQLTSEDTLSLALKSSFSADLRQYYPLAVGNKWQYDYWGEGIVLKELVEVVDARDSLMNGDSVTFFTLRHTEIRRPGYGDTLRTYYSYSWYSQGDDAQVGDLNFSGEEGCSWGFITHTWRDLFGTIRPAFVCATSSTSGSAGTAWVYGVGIASSWEDLGAANLTAYVVGEDSAGVFDFPVGITPPAPAQPRNFSLRAYPNPFNGTTVMSYELPRSSYVSFHIFNLQGRLIKNVELGQLPAGRYTQGVDLSNFASGIYFCVLNAGTRLRVTKLMLIK